MTAINIQRLYPIINEYVSVYREFRLHNLITHLKEYDEFNLNNVNQLRSVVRSYLDTLVDSDKVRIDRRHGIQVYCSIKVRSPLGLNCCTCGEVHRNLKRVGDNKRICSSCYHYLDKLRCFNINRISNMTISAMFTDPEEAVTILKTYG